MKWIIALQGENQNALFHTDPRSVLCAQWFANELQLRKHRPVGRTETYRTASSPSPSLCCVCVTRSLLLVYTGFILPYGLFISLPSLHFFRCLLVTGGSGVSHERLYYCSTVCMPWLCVQQSVCLHAELNPIKAIVPLCSAIGQLQLYSYT